MKKILLVEDDVNVVNVVQKGLSEENFEVFAVGSAQPALEAASSSRFDLIVLDIMLPGTSGLTLCADMRAKGIRTPILFLTALGTAENVALGLNSGADDYLVKPFKFIELLARIHALMRRPDVKEDDRRSTSVLQAGDLKLDDHSKTVTRAGNQVQLTATEYRLLHALLQNKGRVMSRMDLLEKAWDINFNAGTNVVDVYINYLRKKVDGEHHQKLIHTVIGMGYVLREP